MNTPEKPSGTKSSSAEKLWGGRFDESTDAFVEAFTASVTFDQRLYRQDIAGSRAHATMLSQVGVLSSDDLAQINSGLDKIEADIAAGNFSWSVSNEDVHMNIEAALTAKIGDAGKRLHTGRSRNDQVATDIRLYLRDACDEAAAECTRLMEGLLQLADKHNATIMPGFTHLQTAQPVTFGPGLKCYCAILTGLAIRVADLINCRWVRRHWRAPRIRSIELSHNRCLVLMGCVKTH